MKLNIIAAITASFIAAHPAMAQTEDTCAVVGEMSYAIMMGRQNGAPMSAYMAAISNNTNPSSFLNGLMRAVVLDAYDDVRYVNEVDQINAAQEFRNDVEAMCYEAM